MLPKVFFNLFLETKSIVNYFDLIFPVEISATYFKIQPFSSKIVRNKLL